MILNRMTTVMALAVICTAGIDAFADHHKGGAALFDGKTLNGWEQKGGKAKYTVEDGAIVGRSVPNTTNSFLCTKKHYANFILEYEYKCDKELNSGVQIRSQVYEKDTVVQIGKKKKTMKAGRVHGYQVEIDPNKPDRMWSGGIYDEGRRGWLYPGANGGDAKKFTEAGKKAYKPGEWNKVKVHAEGNHIRTWLNGVARTDMKDDMTPKGLIGLQVHGVGKKTETLTVRWRNLTIKVLPDSKKTADAADAPAFDLNVSLSCTSSSSADRVEGLQGEMFIAAVIRVRAPAAKADKKAEKEEGFKSIFNGKNLDGWKVNENPSSVKVVDGAIVVKGPRAHVFYMGDDGKAEFKNVEFKAEVMTKPGANSGIYFHTRYQKSGWPKHGYEAQVNNTHKDPKKTASIYAVKNVLKAPAEDNKWFEYHIIIKGKTITINIDGKEINKYTEPDGKKPGKDFTRILSKGTFALQCHDPGSEVHFRKLRVKVLAD